MSRPTTLRDPWLSLAIKLGGVSKLYDLLRFELNVSESTAKRICRGTGTLTYNQWCIIMSELPKTLKNKQIVRQLIQEILESAQQHPCFMGWEDEVTFDEIDYEGGDCAFVTLDIAWKAKEALERIDEDG